MKAPPSEILVSAIEHMVDFEIPEACIFAQDNAGDFWVPFFFWGKNHCKGWSTQSPHQARWTGVTWMTPSGVTSHTNASISSMRFNGTPTAKQVFQCFSCGMKHQILPQDFQLGILGQPPLRRTKRSMVIQGVPADRRHLIGIPLVFPSDHRHRSRHRSRRSRHRSASRSCYFQCEVRGRQ